MLTDPSNAQRVVTALEEFGFGGLGLASADFEEPDVVVQLGREPQRIDILTFATGLVFEDAYEHRVLVDVGGLPVPFISVDDLRTSNSPRAGFATWPMPQTCRPVMTVASDNEKRSIISVRVTRSSELRA